MYIGTRVQAAVGRAGRKTGCVEIRSCLVVFVVVKGKKKRELEAWRPVRVPGVQVG